jgi:hypothetical protein
MRCLLALLLAHLLVAPATAGAGRIAVEDTMPGFLTLMDFGPTDDLDWYVVNDGVMGGVSKGSLRRTDDGTGLFSGELSLANNGGFSSVRAVVGPTDLSRWEGLELRFRGDGRSYQLRLRTDDRFDGVAYRMPFSTRDGEWTTVRVRFAEFQPTFRGRIIADAPRLDPGRIHQVGFMLADKQAGAFALEIDFVRTWDGRP